LCSVLSFICCDKFAVLFNFKILLLVFGCSFFVHSVSLSQLLVSPGAALTQGEFQEAFTSHVILNVGARGSFYKERWRNELTVHIGKVKQGQTEYIEWTPPVMQIYRRGDFLRFGLAVAKDYSLLQESRRFKPYIGAAAGLTWYRFDEALYQLIDGESESFLVLPESPQLIGSVVVSGRVGLEYLHTPALNFFVQYAYMRQGDPFEDHYFAQWKFASHELSVGMVYHFSLPRKFKNLDKSSATSWLPPS